MEKSCVGKYGAQSGSPRLVFGLVWFFQRLHLISRMYTSRRIEVDIFDIG